MSGKLPTDLPSTVGQVNRFWLSEDEMKQARLLAFRAQKRRNSSFSSLSTVSETDAPHYKGDRRESAPEWRHIRKFLLSRRSSQQFPELGSFKSERRGSFPATKFGLSNDSSFDMARHLLQRDSSRLSSRRQSLQNSQRKWGEMTMTMDDSSFSTAGSSGWQLKFKIILLGDCGVGKSSFLQTFLNGEFTASAPNTNLSMSSAVRTIVHNEKEVELHFYDTAGQERYRSITASYYRHAQGCLLFFNVYNKPSFDHIDSWLEDLAKYNKRDNMTVLLVGMCHQPVFTTHQHDKQSSNDSLTVTTNNTQPWSDLDGDGSSSYNKRSVPKAQIDHLASKHSLSYMESDIKKNPESVFDIVTKLLDLLMHKPNEPQEKPLYIKPKHNSPRSLCCGSC